MLRRPVLAVSFVLSFSSLALADGLPMTVSVENGNVILRGAPIPAGTTTIGPQNPRPRVWRVTNEPFLSILKQLDGKTVNATLAADGENATVKTLDAHWEAPPYKPVDTRITGGDGETFTVDPNPAGTRAAYASELTVAGVKLAAPPKKEEALPTPAPASAPAKAKSSYILLTLEVDDGKKKSTIDVNGLGEVSVESRGGKATKAELGSIDSAWVRFDQKHGLTSHKRGTYNAGEGTVGSMREVLGAETVQLALKASANENHYAVSKEVSKLDDLKPSDPNDALMLALLALREKKEATVEAAGKLSFSGDTASIRMQAMEMHDGPPMPEDCILNFVPTELVGPLLEKAKALDGQDVEITAKLVTWDPPRKIVLRPTSITGKDASGTGHLIGEVVDAPKKDAPQREAKSKGLVAALDEAESGKAPQKAPAPAGPPEETTISDGQSMASIAKLYGMTAQQLLDYKGPDGRTNAQLLAAQHPRLKRDRGKVFVILPGEKIFTPPSAGVNVDGGDAPKIPLEPSPPVGPLEIPAGK